MRRAARYGDGSVEGAGKSMRLSAALALALLVDLAVVQPVGAQPPPPSPSRIIIMGCVMQVGPPGCLSITSGGRQYNVSSAQPPLQLGAVVTLAGTIASRPSVCPGIDLTDITYQPPQAFCQ
jgi:hypothetical protein